MPGLNPKILILTSSVAYGLLDLAIRNIVGGDGPTVFRAYFNWYQVDQHNVIGTLLPQEIVDLTAAGAPPPGTAVIRNPAGQITEIISTYQNLGDQRNNGIEFGIQYTSKEYSWGKIDLDVAASYLYNVKQQTPVGLSPAGGLFYRVFNFTDTFKTGVTLHFTGSELDSTNSANNTNPNETLDAPGYVHLIGNWTTLDWQISYEFGKPAEVNPETPKPGYNKEGKGSLAKKRSRRPPKDRTGEFVTC